MAGQAAILNSTMNRADFLKHYQEHPLAWLTPEAQAPPLEKYRFYNSGVVLARRREMARFCDWAMDMPAERPGDHRVGEPMVADQDYIQYYANNTRPKACQESSRRWNHWEHRDRGHPRPGACAAHLSNFCLDPGWLGHWRIRTAWRRRMG